MRKYIDFNIKLNEIRLLLNHPSYKGKTIVVVEGGTDISLFRSLFNFRSVRIESIDGKYNLVRSMEILIAEGAENILGICDADFDNISGENKKYIEHNIFMTDVHDAEMMMFNSPSLYSFIDEFSNNNNYEEIKDGLKNSVLEAAYKIGLIRWVNHIYKLNLNFKTLNYRYFFNVSKLRIDMDIDELLDCLLIKSTDKSPDATKNFILNKINELDNANEDKMQVCCGHDLTCLIAQIFSQKWASIDTNINQTKVESSFRIGYMFKYFVNTQLFVKLSEWAAQKSVMIFSEV